VSTSGPALFRAFPEIEGLPHRPLLRRPAPVAELTRLAKRAGSDCLWAKRDDAISRRFGGNKARKLEWILAEAIQAGARRLLTVGVVGSNHVLATTVHGIDAQLAVRAVQMPAPLSHQARRSARVCEALGLQIRWAPHPAALPFALAAERARALVDRKVRTYWIAGGGSSAIGTLGYVDAGLELAEQVRAGELPEPAWIVVPAGTGGTLAGLILGCKLAGLKTRVLGVRVVNRAVCNSRSVARLANATLSLLRRSGLPARSTSAIKASDVTLIHSAYGRGYGLETAGGREAVTVAHDLENLPLEPVYSGKAMSGMLSAMLDDPALRRGPTLFWLTAASNRVESLTRGLAEHRQDLPLTYRAFLGS
jgi:D-cysteine desulfhydrase